MKYVDLRARTYLKLITDQESLEAFIVLMDDFSRATWWQFSMLPIDSIPSTLPFSQPLPIQLQRDTLRSKERQWSIEAYKRLDSIQRAQTQPGRASKQSARTLKEETIGSQIRRLREECRWTIEELAEAIGIDERTVRRHESAEAKPQPRVLGSYERVFSKKLERKIVIGKTP